MSGILEPENEAVFATVIAEDLGVQVWQVKAATRLLDAGATVPFVSRYRKEATGALTDVHLRGLEAGLAKHRDLEKGRELVRDLVSEEGVLTEQLEDAIQKAETSLELADLAAPFRRPDAPTESQVAHEAGLEPLADKLLANPSLSPEQEASLFVDPETGIGSVDQALNGAGAILVERAAQDASLITSQRQKFWDTGFAEVKLRSWKTEDEKYAQYADAPLKINELSGHSVLAVLRGVREGALAMTIAEDVPGDSLRLAAARSARQGEIAAALSFPSEGGPASPWLEETANRAWTSKIRPLLVRQIENRLYVEAEKEALSIFAENLRDILLGAPAGNKLVLGLDPAIRTGVKIAVVDETGKVLETETIYPHPPLNKWADALQRLRDMAVKYPIQLIAVGNGTGSRETEALTKQLVADIRSTDPDRNLEYVVVSEAGASVYSASALASSELPNLDVTLRGAVSIARRLQDPLAELVKIPAKALGVGQYQHDLNQDELSFQLDAVVEDCVNAVGADLNTASPSLLARVAGLGSQVSEEIVRYRDERGPFSTLLELHNVPGMTPAIFKQCAGFLRIFGGTEPLDALAIHPEAYDLARSIMTSANISGHWRPSHRALVERLSPESFVTDEFGLPTVRDVIAELAKPKSDPRPPLASVQFREDVKDIADLVPGMILNGKVQNIVTFGVFVDLGVHIAGLVHVSRMAEYHVDNPRDIVRVGQPVQVKVLSVDRRRKRISLTLRLTDSLALDRT